MWPTPDVRHPRGPRSFSDCANGFSSALGRFQPYKQSLRSTALKRPDQKLEQEPKMEVLAKDPKASGKHGTKAFKFLETVTEAINESRSNTPKLKLQLRVTGKTTPLSHRCNTSRPDGYFHMNTVNLSSTVNCGDIVMPMEFKNADNEENKIDDYAKVMWSMHHVMRMDARRRYVHGLTCENTKARLWYNDRSDVVASEFDVNKDWRCLVRIILSILLATDAELGYDPNVVARPFNSVYDITIRNSKTENITIYRTIEVLSDVGVDSMVGRGTRVWLVQKVENDEPVDPFYVLKSIWVHQDRLAEHVILADIRKKQPTYSQYFLTPVDYGLALLDPARSSILFDTHSPLGRERDLKPTGKVLRTCPRPPSLPASTESSSASRDGIRHPEGIPNASEEGFQNFRHLSNHPRQNYLVVFKERGEPVHSLRKFTDIITAIQGGWEGLHAIHLCDHVHRDVSSSNILLVPALDGFSERGVIMDLEYVKDVNDTKAPRDVRVGTEAFMATEVAFMEHYQLSELRLTNPGSTSL